jgi:2-oxoglutarate ferredoxin oxidoreductase subunit alpha
MAHQGVNSGYLRLRAVPFSDQVGEFIRQYDRCYVVEMNRDGQMRQLLTLAYPEYATRLVSIAHTDGLPLTARRVADAILATEEN